MEMYKGVNNPYATVAHVSPTYVSSDLLSPEQKGRITTPAIGCQIRDPVPLGAKTWGENVTSYGGIGKLSFLGRKRARDLYVSRSPRHFSCGFAKYETDLQPYQLTPLLLSACRINDQILPAPLQVAFRPSRYQTTPGVPHHPYFSHASLCEVFPHHDPTRCTAQGNPALSRETIDALCKYSHLLYDSPHYKTSFPNHFKPMTTTEALLQSLRNNTYSKTRQNEDLNDGEVTNRARNTDEPDAKQTNPVGHASQEKEDIKTNTTNIESIKTIVMNFVDLGDLGGLMEAVSLLRQMLDYWKVARLHGFATTGQSADEELLLAKLTSILHGSQPAEMKIQEIRRFLETTNVPDVRDDNGADQNETTDAHVTNEVEGAKLVAVDPGTGTSCPPNCKPSEQHQETHVSLTKETNPPVKDVAACSTIPGRGPTWLPNCNFKVCNRTVQLKEKEEAPLADMPPIVDQGTNTPIERQTLPKNCLKQIKLDSIEGDTVSYLCQDPQTKFNQAANVSWLSRAMGLEPLTSSVSASRNLKKIDNVHFKSDAHRRYKSLYPDIMPDLRDNIQYNKRHFFYGYHASVFR